MEIASLNFIKKKRPFPKTVMYPDLKVFHGKNQTKQAFKSANTK